MESEVGALQRLFFDVWCGKAVCVKLSRVLDALFHGSGVGPAIGGVAGPWIEVRVWAAG